MKPWKMGGLMAISHLALMITGGMPLTADAPQEPAWLTDYQAARATARQSGKPLFVVFR